MMSFFRFGRPVIFLPSVGDGVVHVGERETRVLWAAGLFYEGLTHLLQTRQSLRGRGLIQCPSPSDAEQNEELY